MKTVILAGGRGTRMGEETDIIPKPMIRIGGIPILKHIMTYYAKYGHKDFVILGGYKIDVIIKYFEEEKDINTSDWNIEIVDTGVDTLTGQRLLEAEPLLQDDEFMLTYGDGLSNVSLTEVEHRRSRIGILTAVHPPGRFGTLTFKNKFPGDIISKFDERQRLDSVWINGGFMCLGKDVFKYIEKDEMLEFDVLPRLAEEEQLTAYFHEGWWQCMDTPRDKEYLEKIWGLKRCYWR